MKTVCYSCGNKTRFSQWGLSTGRCRYSERRLHMLNEYGDYKETLDSEDFDNSDTEEDEFEYDGNIDCHKCDNGIVRELEDDDWEKWQEGVSVSLQVGFNKEEDCFSTKEKGKLDELKVRMIGGRK